MKPHNKSNTKAASNKRPAQSKHRPTKMRQEPAANERMSEKPLQAGSGEKAYKLLAKQMGISNSEAKALIDRGLVFSHGRKVLIARAMMAKHTVFKVEQPPKAQVIFEDENLLVVNKPPFRDSEEIAKEFGFPLLHRLDRETSGVLMLVKNSDFQKKAIEAFRKEEVAKEYLAIVQGIVAEGGQIDKPIVTTKGHFAKSRVAKEGKCALTIYEPLEVAGGRTKLAVKIVTGRTHQIRVHLAYIRHPIVGDRLYGGPEAKRMMLHAWKVSLMGLEFEAEPTQEFSQFAHS